MIAQDRCMEEIVAAVPEFGPAWQAHLAYWDDEAAGLSNDVTEFAGFFVDSADTLPEERRREILALAERLLEEGDEAVKDAVATCFLETLLNAASGGEIAAERFVPHLGPQSRAFCRAWDEYTDVRTPGL